MEFSHHHCTRFCFQESSNVNVYVTEGMNWSSRLRKSIGLAVATESKAAVRCCNLLKARCNGVTVCFMLRDGWKLYDTLPPNESIRKYRARFTWSMYILKLVCDGKRNGSMRFLIHGRMMRGKSSVKAAPSSYEFITDFSLLTVELVCHSYEPFNSKLSEAPIRRKFLRETSSPTS